MTEIQNSFCLINLTGEMHLSNSKKSPTMDDYIRSNMGEGEVIGKEVIINSEKAYEASLEGSGLDKETVEKVLQHDKQFITSFTRVTGEVATKHFEDNSELEAVVSSAAVDPLHSHTVRVQKMHEPVEGKPQYGLVQVHSAFGMDESTSEEFKKVSRSISKNIRAIAES